MPSLRQLLIDTAMCERQFGVSFADARSAQSWTASPMTVLFLISPLSCCFVLCVAEASPGGASQARRVEDVERVADSLEGVLGGGGGASCLADLDAGHILHLSLAGAVLRCLPRLFMSFWTLGEAFLERLEGPLVLPA